jgi:hypothetical protein
MASDSPKIANRGVDDGKLRETEYTTLKASVQQQDEGTA